MKTIHNGLIKRFVWYKNWHESANAEQVHYLALLAMTSVDLYLGINLLMVVS